MENVGKIIADFKEKLDKIAEHLRALPAIDYGTVKLEKQGWQRVNFKFVFTEKPTVLCFGEAKYGSWKSIPVEIPTVKKPTITPPVIPQPPKIQLSTSIPTISFTPISIKIKTPDVTLPTITLSTYVPTIDVKKIKDKIKEILSVEVPKITLPELKIPKSLLPLAGNWDVQFYKVLYSWGYFGSTIGDKLYDVFPSLFHMDWGEGAIVGAYSDKVGFKATNWIYVPYKMGVKFIVGGDDGYRLYIRKRGQSWSRIISNWSTHGYEKTEVTKTLTEGYYDLRLEWYEWSGSASITFIMIPPPIPTEDLNVHFWMEQTGINAILSLWDVLLNKAKDFATWNFLGAKIKFGDWFLEPVRTNIIIRNLLAWFGKTLGRGFGSTVASLARTLFKLTGSLYSKINVDLDSARDNVMNAINDLIFGDKGVKDQVEQALKNLLNGWRKPDGTWQDGLKDKIGDAFDVLRDEIKAKVEEAFSKFISNEDLTGVKDQVEAAFSRFRKDVISAIVDAILYVLEGGEDYDGLKAEINNALDSLRKDIQLKVQKAFETLITNVAGTGIKDQVEKAFYKNNRALIASINESLSKFSDEIVSAVYSMVEDFRRKVQASVNKVLPELWETLGLPEGALISTVLYRNVDAAGFEVYVPKGGITIHYLALGRRVVF